MLDFYRNKKVFIIGHTGFKGAWLSRILILSGAHVTGYALDSPTKPSLFHLSELDKDVNSVFGDVREYDKLLRTISESTPEIVFHLAAQPLVRLSYEQPLETYSTNIMGTVNLLEAIRNTTSVASVINITTDKVYENKEWVWGYRENENLNGYDPYSNSKSCSELITSSYRNAFYSQSNTAAISTARSGNVIGGGDFAKDRIIPDCVRAVEKKAELIIRNPHSIRPYQHVLECLSGYLLLAQKQYEKKSFEGSYNFGPNEEGCVTTGNLVEKFFNAWGDGSWKVQGDGGPHEASYLKLDCSKAKNVLGWKPKWNIDQAINQTIVWTKGYLENRDINDLNDEQIIKYFDC